MADFDTFVSVFEEFVLEPKPKVDYWLSQAPLQLNAGMFGKNFDLAAMLFAAHFLTLRRRDALVADNNGIPGDARGPISSKTVGPLSTSYDTGSVATPGAGPWNATSYGQQLYKMMQAAACGGVVRAVRPDLGPFVGVG